MCLKQLQLQSQYGCRGLQNKPWLMVHNHNWKPCPKPWCRQIIHISKPSFFNTFFDKAIKDQVAYTSQHGFQLVGIGNKDDTFFLFCSAIKMIHGNKLHNKINSTQRNNNNKIECLHCHCWNLNKAFFHGKWGTNGYCSSVQGNTMAWKGYQPFSWRSEGSTLTQTWDIPR